MAKIFESRRKIKRKIALFVVVFIALLLGVVAAIIRFSLQKLLFGSEYRSQVASYIENDLGSMHPNEYGLKYRNITIQLSRRQDMKG